MKTSIRKYSFVSGVAIILALILTMGAGVSGAKEAASVPDTTKMSPIQLMAWRASQQGKSTRAVEVLPDMPAGITRLTETDGQESEPCWSPDGKYIYYTYAGQGHSMIRRLDPVTGEVEMITSPDTRCKSPSVSPSGTHIAFEMTSSSLKSKIWIIRLADGQQAKLTSAAGIKRELAPCWNSNGYKIYFALSGNKSLKTSPWEIRRDGEQEKMVLDDPGQHSQPRLSRAGDNVAWVYQMGSEISLRVINTKISAIYQDHPFDGMQITSYDWLPGDNSMIISYFDPDLDPKRFNLGIYDFETDTHSLFMDLGKSETYPRVSPDGKSLVFVSNRNGQKDLFLSPLP
jgi:Tol biopolymer transport system component